MLSSDSTHVCPRCKRELPLTSEFWYKNKTTPHGYHYQCKNCQSIQQKQWRINNSEKKAETDRRYYESNKDVMLLKSRERYRQNRERYAASNKLWRKANPDKVNAARNRWLINNPEKRLKSRMQWDKCNPEKKLIAKHRRRADDAQSEGSYTDAEIRALYEQQRGLCFHCGCDISHGFHRDHWIPLSRGGSNWIENIRLLCSKCNLSKSNKLPHEWCPEKYPPSTSD